MQWTACDGIVNAPIQARCCGQEQLGSLTSECTYIELLLSTGSGGSAEQLEDFFAHLLQVHAYSAVFVKYGEECDGAAALLVRRHPAPRRVAPRRPLHERERERDREGGKEGGRERSPHRPIIFLTQCDRVMEASTRVVST